MANDKVAIETKIFNDKIIELAVENRKAEE